MYTTPTEISTYAPTLAPLASLPTWSGIAHPAHLQGIVQPGCLRDALAPRPAGLHAGGRSQARSCAARKPCRSEEHTSELQSLMRNSYAVFCSKKKTKQHTTHKKTRVQT